MFIPNYAAIAKTIAAATATDAGPNIERVPYAKVEQMLGHRLSAASRARFKEEWEAACDNWFISHTPPAERRTMGLPAKKRRAATSIARDAAARSTRRATRRARADD